MHRGWLPRRAAWGLVLAQAPLVGGALLAQRTGEADEERAEARRSEAAIHAHEDAAEVFTGASVAVLALLVLGAALPSERFGRLSLAGATAGTALVLGLGVQLGHKGGALVHDPVASAPSLATRPVGEGGEGDEGGDEDDEDSD